MLGGKAGVERLDARADRGRATARPDEVERATHGAWWAWRWRGWAEWRLDRGTLVLAGLAVVLDVVTAWADLSLGHLGRIPISPALPLALAVAARIGAGALGCSRRGVHAWREYAIGIGVVLAIAVGTYGSDVGGFGEAVGLLVAAVGEELVYRLAVIVLVGALVARACRREWRTPSEWGTGPGVVALLVGAVAFSALPGHVAQMQDVASTLSFASLALVLGWVVLRTGAIWPAIVAHAVLNLATITAFTVAIPAGLSLGLVAATLLALVAAADVAGRRTGRLRPVPSEIDLTAVPSRS